MSINSILGTARLALTAQQVAIETASHNIANAGVEGYSRQRVMMEANRPNQTVWGSVGTGVLVNNIERVRDELLDGTYYQHSTQAKHFGTRHAGLTKISEMFNEPSEDGLSSSLDKFWSAWGDLENAPSNSAARSVVQQRGAQVASTLNRFSKGIDVLAAEQQSTLQADVTEVNRITTQIADLNRQIVAAEAGGTTASDLRDTRDRLVDSLSERITVRVMPQQNGSLTVYAAGATIVDGAQAKQMSVQESGSTFRMQVNGSALPLYDVGGSIGASITLLNTDIPAAKTQLDQIAQQLVTTVNTIHRTGWTAAGDALGGSNWNPATPPTGSNINFFDPAGGSAATISLSAQVTADASYVAAGNIQNGTGNNAVASQLSQLRSTSSILKYGSATQQTSFGDYYRDFVTRVGVDTDSANTASNIHQTLASNANTRRLSVSGVSTDEELISITKFQQAYAAAAKVITTADEMARTILDMVR